MQGLVSEPLKRQVREAGWETNPLARQSSNRIKTKSLEERKRGKDTYSGTSQREDADGKQSLEER
jgi:hypothetical protein